MFIDMQDVIRPVTVDALCTAQKMTFSIKDFFSKCDQIRRILFPADLLIFTEEILNGKLHFLSRDGNGRIDL